MRTKLLISLDGTSILKVGKGVSGLAYELKEFMLSRDLIVEELSLVRQLDGLFILSASVSRCVEDSPLGFIDFSCKIVTDDDVDKCNDIESLFNEALGDL